MEFRNEYRDAMSLLSPLETVETERTFNVRFIRLVPSIKITKTLD